MFDNDEDFEGVEVNTPVGSFRAGKGRGWARDEDADEEYRRAKRRVRRVMAFYRHLTTAVTTLLLLLVLDIITGVEGWWVQWVAVVWAIILLIHFLNVFVFEALLGREAEKRLIERELGKRQGGRV
jgi:hypothetical protein